MKNPAQVDFRIRGRVIGQATHRPIAGLTVSAYGARRENPQQVGAGVSDDKGRFEMTLDVPREMTEMEVVLIVRDWKQRDVPVAPFMLTIRRSQDVHVEFIVPRVEHGEAWPEIQSIQGEPVNVGHAAKLTWDDLIATYRFIRGRGEVPKQIELVNMAFPTLFAPRSPHDDCGEGHLAALRFYLREKSGAGDRLTGDADEFPAGAVVRSFYTENVQVEYTTDAGYPDDKVPAPLPGADAEVLLSDGTVIGHVRRLLADLHPDNSEVAPACVQEVGVIAQHALERFLSPAFAFRDPRAGAQRLKVRILNCGAAGITNAGWDHVQINNHNSFPQNLHTVPHELCHRVQYQYHDTMDDKSGIYGAVREGGARLIEDAINDQTNSWVASAVAMLQEPKASLTETSYESVLLWKYVAEQHSTQISAADEPAIGIDAYRRVLEASATRLPSDPGFGYDPLILRTARLAMASPAFGGFDQFRYFDAASTELDTHETTLGNFLVANYIHGTATPVSDRRFDYLEDDEPVASSFAPPSKLADERAAIYGSDDLDLAAGASILRSMVNLPAWAARYYRVKKDSRSPARLVRVRFDAGSTMTDPLVQILRIGHGGALVDIHRSDQPSYSKTIDLTGLDSVVVIVASRSTGGSYDIRFEEVATATDTMITRWNSREVTEYEVNPAGWAWTWTSPDIMVDNDNDGLADTQVFFGTNNRLKVRLRNRGTQGASGVNIDFWYQKATPLLSTTAWIPVANLAGVIQSVSGATLAAGGTDWFAVDWAPVDDGTGHQHWCVKVQVTAAGEPNTDNKMAFTNFSHVVASGQSMPLLVRLPAGFAVSRLHAVPRGPRWTIPLSPIQSEIHSQRTSAGCGCDDKPGLAASSRPVRICVVERQKDPDQDGDGCTRTHHDAEPIAADLRMLPPGVHTSQLVTLVQVIDRMVVGGITYAVDRRSVLNPQRNAPVPE